jgi:hypothetical protein
MPIFDFYCPWCGATKRNEFVLRADDPVVCTSVIGCGLELRATAMCKDFGQNRFVGKLASYMSNDAYDSRARNRAEFIDTPETQAKLRSGEWGIAPAGEEIGSGEDREWQAEPYKDLNDTEKDAVDYMLATGDRAKMHDLIGAIDE